jgi:hypothetical protein
VTVRHWTQEDMILHYYGEPARRDAHLAVCTSCRSEYDALARQLAEMNALEPPERGEAYPVEVWNAIRPRMTRLPARPFWHAWRPPRPLAWAAVAALVLIAFLVGRLGAPAPEPRVAEVSPQGPTPVLLVALGDHLVRSKMVLVELANAPERGPVDVSVERTSASELLGANRLYRQTAREAGERDIEELLDDLELLLVEIAHGPERMSPADLRELRDRIESRAVLFKMRVLGPKLEPAPPAPVDDGFPLQGVGE